MDKRTPSTEAGLLQVSDDYHQNYDPSQEEAQAQEDIIKALRVENDFLRSGSVGSTIVETLENKLREYMNAVAERDSYIGKLQSSLSKSNEEHKIAEISSTDRNREIDHLKVQLNNMQQIAEHRSHKDYLDLKNKLISLQEARAEDKVAMDTVSKELQEKTRLLGINEQKFRLLSRTHNDLKDKHYKEMNETKEKFLSLEESNLKEVNKLKITFGEGMKEQEKENTQKTYKLEEVSKKLKVAHDEIESLVNIHEEEKIKMTIEVESLMGQLQEAQKYIVIAQAKNEKQVLDYENQIRELSSKYTQELKELIDTKTAYEEEMSQIKPIIESLEKSQMESIKNYESIRDDRIKSDEQLKHEILKTQDAIQKLALEEERGKNLEKEIENINNELLSCEQLLKNETDTKNELIKKYKMAEDAKNLLDSERVEQDLKFKMITESESQTKCFLTEERNLRLRNEELVNTLNTNLAMNEERNKICVEELCKLKSELEMEVDANKDLNTKLCDSVASKDGLSRQYEEKCKELEFILKESEELSINKEVLALENGKLINEIKDLKAESVELEKMQESKVLIEQELDSIKDELMLLRSSAEEHEKNRKDCIESKDEITSLNEKLSTLQEIIIGRNVEIEARDLEINSLNEQLEKFNASSDAYDEDDHLSFNEKIRVLNERLEETETITEEFHKILEENLCFKNDLQVLNLKLRETLSNQEKLEADGKTLVDAKNVLSNENKTLKAKIITLDEKIKLLNVESQQCKKEFQPRVDIPISIDAASPNKSFPTSPNNMSPRITTKTIEEDYMLEEITFTPKRVRKRLYVDGKEGKPKSNKDVQSSDDIMSGIEKHKKQHHEDLFLIKSLENENSCLKRALQCKKRTNDAEIDLLKKQIEQFLSDKNLLQHEMEILNQLVKNLKGEIQLHEKVLNNGNDCEDAKERNSFNESMVQFCEMKLRNSLEAESNLRNYIILQRSELGKLNEILSDEIEDRMRLLTEQQNLFEKMSRLESENSSMKMIRSLSCESISSDQYIVRETSSLLVPNTPQSPIKRDVDLCIFESKLKSMDCFKRGLTLALKERDQQIESLKSSLDCVSESILLSILNDLEGISNKYSETREDVQKLISKNNLVKSDCEFPLIRGKEMILLGLQLVYSCIQGCFTDSHLKISLDELFSSTLNKIPGIPEDELSNAGMKSDQLKSLAALTEKLEEVLTVQRQNGEIFNGFFTSFEIYLKDLLEPALNMKDHRISKKSNSLEESCSSEDEVNEEIKKIDLHDRQESLKDDLREKEDLLKEFEEITSNIVQQAREEKVEMLQNQRLVFVKVLEQNQTTISEIFSQHIEEMKQDSSISNSDILEAKVLALRESIAESLATDASNIEKEYCDLLTQYIYKQKMNSETHEFMLKDLKQRINDIIDDAHKEKDASKYPIASDISLLFGQSLSENIEVSNQERKTEESPKIFHGESSEKLILYHVTQVTLYLLHYYSISQNSGPIGEKLDVRFDSAMSIPRDASSHMEHDVGIDKLHSLEIQNDTDFSNPSQFNLNSFSQSSCIYPEKPSIPLHISKNLSQKPSNLSAMPGIYNITHIDNQPDSLELQTDALDNGRDCMALNYSSEAPTILDTTGVSEGMLEDIEKDEQLKLVLSTRYQNLKSTLNGKFNLVNVEGLGREIQELVISIQASAGMLKIHMATQGSSREVSEIGNSTLKDENISNKKSQRIINNSLYDMTQYPLSPYLKVDKQGSTLSGTDSLDNYSSLEDAPNSIETFDSKESPIVTSGFEDGSAYTTLKLMETYTLEDAIQKLKEDEAWREDMLLKYHQAKGLLNGLSDEKKKIESKNVDLMGKVKNLEKELQEFHESGKPKQRKQDLYTNLMKKQTSRDEKDKVKLILSAKSKEFLNKSELLERVGDLERILEEISVDKDKEVKELRINLDDKTQQLETADRHLKNARQFHEVHVVERDQELMELQKNNQELLIQVKERDILSNQILTLQEEIESLEKECRESNANCEAQKLLCEQTNTERAVAIDQVKRLREQASSLEMQLNASFIQNQELTEKVKNLTNDLLEEKKRANFLNAQLETQHETKVTVIQKENVDEMDQLEQTNYKSSVPSACTSLMREISDKSDSFNGLHHFLSKLEKSTQCLENLQAVSNSHTLGSEEDYSDGDNLEMTALSSLEDTRSLSPDSLEQILDEKLARFERTIEASVKHARDLEMQLKNLEIKYEEVSSEKEKLYQQVVEFNSYKEELESVGNEYEASKIYLEKEIFSFSKRLAESNLQCERMSKEIESYQNRYQQSLSAIEKLEKTKHDLLNKDAELESAHAIDIEFKEKYMEVKRINSELSNKLLVLDNSIKEAEIYRLKLEFEYEELSKEKDTLKRYNSDQLLQISKLEAKVEELRRTESPVDQELKQRMVVLTEEYERCQSQLVSKFREGEELNYSIKELKEKLMLREEEVDKLNQAILKSSSSPTGQLTEDTLKNYKEMQTKILDQELIIAELQNKLKGKIPEIDDLSKALKDGLIEEKNAMIQSLEKKIILLKQELMKIQCRSPNNEELHDMDDAASRECGLFSFGSEQSSMEIQRRQAKHDDLDEFLPIHSSPNIAINKTILSQESISHANISLESIRNKKTRLESDFKDAQEMLEAKESEISVLMEEAEDNVPDHSSNDILLLEEKVNSLELAYENKEIELASLMEFPNRLKESERQNNKLIDTVKFLEEERDKLITATNELRKYEDKLENEKNVAEKELSNVRENNLAYARSVKKLQSALDDYKKRKSELKGELKTASENNTKLLDNIKLINTDAETYQKKINDLEQQLLSFKPPKQLSKDVQTDNFVDPQFSLLKKDNDDLRSRLKLSNLKIKEKDVRQSKEIKKITKKHEADKEELTKQNLERESQLCSEYESRISAQASAHAIEKDSALKELSDFYEDQKISKSSSEEREGIEHNQRASDLQDQLNHQLDTSNNLDNNILAWLDVTDEASPTAANSTADGESKRHELRAGSNESNFSDADQNVIGKLRFLMKKVYREGMKVLTLTEQTFLEKNQSHLDETQQSIIASTLSGTRNGNISPTFEEVDSNAVEPRVFECGDLNNVLMSIGEDRLRRDIVIYINKLKEEYMNEIFELKKQVSSLEVDADFSRSFIKDLNNIVGDSRSQSSQLRDKLSKEQCNSFELITQNSKLKNQLHLMERQMQNALMDLEAYNLRLESREDQIVDLEVALQRGRTHFNIVSSNLDRHKQLSEVNKEHQQKILQEMRACMESERKHMLHLVSQLQASQPAFASTHKRVLNITELNSDESLIETSFSQVIDDNPCNDCIELKRLTQSLSEKLSNEREDYISKLNSEQRLTREVHEKLNNAEMEKTRIEKELIDSRACCQRLESQLNENEAHYLQMNKNLECELKKAKDVNKEYKNSLLTEEEQRGIIERMKAKGSELVEMQKYLLHVKNELDSLKENINVESKSEGRTLSNTEVKIVNSKWRNLKNIGNFLEVQQKENIELFKSLQAITNEKRELRLKILELEATVVKLRQKLDRKEKITPLEGRDGLDLAERLAYEKENSSLTSALNKAKARLLHYENQNKLLENQLKNSGNQGEVTGENLMTNYYQIKLLRSESYRESLVHQKSYLSAIVNGYVRSEKRLHQITRRAEMDLYQSKASDEVNKLKPMNKFRSVGFVIIAVHRMKFIQRHWDLTARLRSKAITGPSHENFELISRPSRRSSHTSRSSLLDIENFNSRDNSNSPSIELLNIRTGVIKSASNGSVASTLHNASVTYGRRPETLNLSRNNLFDEENNNRGFRQVNKPRGYPVSSLLHHATHGIDEGATGLATGYNQNNVKPYVDFCFEPPNSNSVSHENATILTSLPNLHSLNIDNRDVYSRRNAIDNFDESPNQARGLSSFTGLTPPTKDHPLVHQTMDLHRRNLFSESEKELRTKDYFK